MVGPGKFYGFKSLPNPGYIVIDYENHLNNICGNKIKYHNNDSIIYNIRRTKIGTLLRNKRL